MENPYYNDDDGNDYYYGLNERQIRAKLEYAINGDDDDDDASEDAELFDSEYEPDERWNGSLDFGDLNDEEPDDDE